MVLQHIEEIGDHNAEKVKNEYIQKLEAVELEKDELKAIIKQLRSLVKEQELEVEAQKDKTRVTKIDLEKAQSNLEKEVELRLKFEKKLNALHAVHRDLMTKHAQV